KIPVGPSIANIAERFGVKFFVPSSSMHRYQRTDSIFADEYTTPLDAYARGFSSKTVELLPAFIRFDCEKEQLERIDPRENLRVVRPREEVGDDWSERLEPQDRPKLQAYFQAVQHLHQSLDFITLRVGGTEHRIDFNKRAFNRGITFEVPRSS